MERKRSCEIVTFLKKYVEKSSSEKNAIEGNVFWKSGHSKKTALRKK